MKTWATAAILITAIGCKAEEPSVGWLDEPPIEVSDGEEFTATWSIDGVDVAIDHTNMHACPDTADLCDSPPRVDSDVHDGESGEYTGTITLTEGTWFLHAHARVNEDTDDQEDYYADFIEVTVVAVTGT